MTTHCLRMTVTDPETKARMYFVMFMFNQSSLADAQAQIPALLGVPARFIDFSPTSKLMYKDEATHAVLEEFKIS